MTRVLIASALAVSVLAMRAGIAADAQGKPVMVAPGPMVPDGATRSARQRGRRVIRDGRMVCVGPAAECRTPGEAQAIGARGKWVIPGLIDAHVHISEAAQAGIG